MRSFLSFCLLFALLGAEAVAQQQVTGKVTDPRGEPLPGVNIVIKNTQTGTVSNVDGTYALKVS
jgi:hypothetical protein